MESQDRTNGGLRRKQNSEQVDSNWGNRGEYAERRTSISKGTGLGKEHRGLLRAAGGALATGLSVS
jgi:hypothetical protein